MMNFLTALDLFTITCTALLVLNLLHQYFVNASGDMAPHEERLSREFSKRSLLNQVVVLR